MAQVGPSMINLRPLSPDSTQEEKDDRLRIKVLFIPVNEIIGAIFAWRWNSYLATTSSEIPQDAQVVGGPWFEPMNGCFVFYLWHKSFPVYKGPGPEMERVDWSPTLTMVKTRIEKGIPEVGKPTYDTLVIEDPHYQNEVITKNDGVIPEELELIRWKFRPHYQGHDRLLSERAFDYCGVKVVEYICQWDDEKRKLIWVRDGIDTMEIDGRSNPMVHLSFIPEYDSYGSGSEYSARQKVAEAFRGYWSLKDDQ